jgi:hypothetical protein
MLMMLALTLMLLLDAIIEAAAYAAANDANNDANMLNVACHLADAYAFLISLLLHPSLVLSVSIRFLVVIVVSACLIVMLTLQHICEMVTIRYCSSLQETLLGATSAVKPLTVSTTIERSDFI